jgi:hypothetical protein
MKPRVTLRQAIEDPELLGSALAGPTWHAWRVIPLAAMGEHLGLPPTALLAPLCCLPVTTPADIRGQIRECGDLCCVPSLPSRDHRDCLTGYQAYPTLPLAMRRR